MIEMRRAQRSFGDCLIAEEVEDLREGWMEHADRLLDDEAIVAACQRAAESPHFWAYKIPHLGGSGDQPLT